jgi:polysaccharide export outer membrane protein
MSYMRTTHRSGGFMPSTRVTWRNTLVPVLLVSSFVFFASVNVIAQTSSSPAVSRVPGTANASPNARPEDMRYRIGPGDVLGIVVRKAPELSVEAVRVDQRGMIRIPMIDDAIMAACKTEGELAAQIATLYLEYKKSPSVEVFVRDFQSRPVAVIGAVNQPGQFRLQRQVRLLELLSFAGGPTEKAGRVIDVVHSGSQDICQKGSSENDGESMLQSLGVYRLDQTLKGTDGANPFVQPGDIVSLPEADQVFVVGHVIQPRSISLQDKPITLTRAIAMAGGTQRDSKTSAIRIIRQSPDGMQKQEIVANLSAIEKQRAPDIILLPNDIVNVPSSATKTLINALQGAIAPSLTNGTIRAIP